MATMIPTNHARFTSAELLRLTAGRALGAELPVAIEGVCTDTRQLRAGELFIALRGENHDAHDHLERAAAAGAALALVERPVSAAAGLPLIEVPSSLSALAALARHHTQRWRQQDGSRRLVAITGSAGKTTTKDAVTGLLLTVADGDVHQTPGNLNNLIGVPMTLLGLSDRHVYGVIEMGTNAPGEIATLAAMAGPDVALVTLVAHAHTEGLGSIDDVAREKLSLFASLDPAAGIAIGNGDDARIAADLRQRGGQRVSYGHVALEAVPSYVIRHCQLTDSIAARIELERPTAGALTIETSLLGRAGALACAAALATVEALGLGPLDQARAQTALSQLSTAGRLQLHRAGDGLLVLDDSYNANPASMLASIELAAALAKRERRRLVLVLGEMRELGEQSVAQHRQVGAAAASSGADFVIAVSGDAEHLADAVQLSDGIAHFVLDAADAVRLACEFVERQDVVLVKGSRGVRTEAVVDALLEQHERHTLPGGRDPNLCGTLAP